MTTALLWTLSLLLAFPALCMVNSTNGRSKRNLIFPEIGPKIQLITGFGIPIPLQNHAITLGVVIKFNYNLPENASVFISPYVVSARDKIALHGLPTRWNIYAGMEAAINRLGLGLDGHECLLRSVCEVAAVPFDHNSGLAAELMHILFTPSSSNEVEASQPERDFSAAERLGRTGLESCKDLQKSCPFGLIELISQISKQIINL